MYSNCAWIICITTVKIFVNPDIEISRRLVLFYTTLWRCNTLRNFFIFKVHDLLARSRVVIAYECLKNKVPLSLWFPPCGGRSGYPLTSLYAWHHLNLLGVYELLIVVVHCVIKHHVLVCVPLPASHWILELVIDLLDVCLGLLLHWM